MKRYVRITLDDKLVTDEGSPFQAIVVKTGAAEIRGRGNALGKGLAMVAYAICDLADAIRERPSA